MPAISPSQPPAAPIGRSAAVGSDGPQSHPRPSHRPPALGKLIITGSLADLAIGGGGAFPIVLGGDFFATRVGTMTMRPGEPIGHEAGGSLFPQIIVPDDAVTVVVSAYGDVLAVTSPGECKYLGTIRLLPSPQAGRLGRLRWPLIGAPETDRLAWPGSTGAGHILQGAVELPAGVNREALGQRFDGGEAQVLGGSLRLTSATAVRVAKALRSARKRKESQLDVSLAGTQAAQLVGSVTAGNPRSIVATVAHSRSLTGVEPAAEVLAQLARRMTPQGIVASWLFNRRFDQDRFPPPAPNGENGRRVPQDQELQLAQTRARLDWSGRGR